MKQTIFITLLLIACAGIGTANAQLYTPVALAGFNNDVVAEAGSSSTAVTTTVLDLSDYVLYSAAFATTNTINGGMADNGTLSTGTRTYQLAGYTASNALYLSASGAAAGSAASGVLTLTTPAMFTKLSLLVFSTEGNSTLSVVLKFTDGTTVNAGNFSVLDWFNGTNAVVSGFGRITRKTSGPYAPDGLTTNPRFYPLDITIACADQSKLLQSITVNYISGSGANTRAAVLAASGAVFTPLSITPAITTASCGAANGSIKLTTRGGTTPLSFRWNTTPAQTTATATGLTAGTYTCTITDANSCVSTWQGTVDQTPAVTLSAVASTPDICIGDNITLSVTANGGTASDYTWTPGNLTGSSVTVSPATNTTYTVNAKDAFGCAVSATVPVTVKPVPVAAFTVTPARVCLPAEQNIQFTGNAGNAAIYDWNNFAGASVKSGLGAGPYAIQFAKPGKYTLQLKVTENGCASPVAEQEVTVAGPLQSPVITVAAVTTSSITFSWPPVAGATAYQVSINGVLYGNPGAATTCTITGLQPLQMITLEVIAMGDFTCQNSAIAKASAKTLSDQIFIPNSFTPNGDGKNDVFRPYGNVIAGMEMKIFNQWGELICESRELTTGWDGTQKGKVQPMGVYTYVMRLLLADGTELKRKGVIHLIH
jgi:gliding motility-associated-like protein